MLVVVGDDGSLAVREELTFSYSGSFEGAYRDIPVGPGEQIADVVVSENGVAYSPGADTELGSSGGPGTYGVEDLGSRLRVVWHYRASDEDRTYTISYRMTGLAVAYDDVVDVYLKVWGDEWDFSLDALDAAMILPSGARDGDVRVWGHPSSVHGSTDLGADGVTPTLTATGVPSRQWVEMRVTFPRALLTSTGGASVRDGNGLDGILAEEQAYDVRSSREAAAAAERERARTTSLVAVLLFLIPIPVGALWAFRRYGAEPRVDYDREYEQEPPSDHPPALVGALVSQGAADEAEFTATLFDLIRQKALTAVPVSVDHSTWAGLRHEQISDLEIGAAEGEFTLKEYERSVLTVVNRVVEDGPTPLSDFRKKIRADAAANAATYSTFRDRVRKGVASAGLIDDRARVNGPVIVGAILLGIGAFGYLVLAPLLDAWFSFIDKDVLRPGIVVITILGLGFAVWLSSRPRVWVRRTREGALLSARWMAFRRYLQDFSRLEEAPPMSLVLWERYLVYGIALGVADDVLEAARLKAPIDVESSDLYWYGNQGFGGHSSNGITGIEKALTGAFRAPSSGGGGGFSGGGGCGGGGGGGGGAW